MNNSMDENLNDGQQPIPPDIYDREYFLKARGGSGEFIESCGKNLYYGHQYVLQLANLKSTEDVLDVGCGCGEVTLNAALRTRSVTGFDYASEAIELAKEAKQGFDRSVQDKVDFVVADVDSFSWGESKYDVVFLSM